jgi:hypothetical protein
LSANQRFPKILPHSIFCKFFLDFFTYHAEATAQGHTSDSADFSLANKRRVIQFVKEWYRVIGEAAFMSERTIQAFLEVNVVKYIRSQHKGPSIKIFKEYFF